MLRELVTVLAYVADVWILASYFYMVRTSKIRQYNYTNVVAAPPLIASEVYVGAWQPMILSVAFAGIAVMGLCQRSS